MDHESHGRRHQENCYGDFSPTGHPGIQSFEPSHELIGLQSGMEMLGIPSKQQQSPDSWRVFFPKAGVGFTQSTSEDLMVESETAAPPPITNPWQHSNRMAADDSSLRCLFPIEGNEQPPQGQPLSLFNPESFHQHLSSNTRDGLFSKPTNLQQDGMLYTAPSLQQTRSSKYLIPAQELLSEFCSLGRSGRNPKQHKPQRPWDEGASSSSSTWNQSLNTLGLLELQKLKARLVSMLEEVDRRYRRYCDQMRCLVSAFEAVAGDGAATVYSTLASKAMSKHFRCLRDGIMGQIQAMTKAMGEKEPVTPGSTRGETPRLRLLDQCLRQQKAFQQAGAMENHPWRPQRGLPERSVSVLRAWLFEHFLHPYPSDIDKHILARQAGLSRGQVSNWFINARVRLWKPMVEEMYMEETKEQDNQSSDPTVGYGDNNNSNSSSCCHPTQLRSNWNPNPNPSTSQLEAEDQKPAAPGQLMNDSDSLSSIINSSHRRDLGDPAHGKNTQQQQVLIRAENFGMVGLDFSSYNECAGRNFGSGVSLTLGLQQHDMGGVSLSFSPASQRHDLFFAREEMDNNQPVQFSITDGEAQQNLPYRNLMGAQLLHDLAG